MHVTDGPAAGTAGPPPKILMAAGEVSGDRQGAYLAAAILAQNPEARLFGAGGDRMRQAGVDIRVETSHLGCTGLQESLRYALPLWRVYGGIRKLARDERPDIAVLIDNEGFNTALAGSLSRAGVPVVFYFAPQVWLWAERRARSVSRIARAIVCAFAPEAEVYKRYGGRAVWLGHPLVDVIRAAGDEPDAVERLGLDPARPLMAIMPGSRFHEVERMGRAMLLAARRISQRVPDVQIVLPLAAPHLRPALEREFERTGMTSRVTVIDEHVYACLRRCRVLLTAAGTATLEAALLGVPMIVGCRISALSFALLRLFRKTSFVAMPNILAGERIVPEFVQRGVNPDDLAAEALAILEDPKRAEQMKASLARIRELLGAEGVLARVATLLLAEARAARASGVTESEGVGASEAVPLPANGYRSP